MPYRGAYDFLPQERVVFGVPAAQAVVEEADRLQAERLLLVSTRSVSRGTDIVAGIRDALGPRCVGLFDESREHTPRATVIAATEAARAAAPDLIVTVGGGSAIDLVKVLQICLAEDLRDEASLDPYYLRVDADGRRTAKPVQPSPARQIIVPTTLSGAEFSNLGGCTDERRGVKDLFTAHDIIGRSVILDPAVTVHTPAPLWLSTGVRAVDHAVEGICSGDAHPFTDGLNVRALKLLGEGLPRCRDDGGDLEARLQCQLAVWMASMGIGRVQYGASHGIGHALGAVAAVPHGHTSCVMLPAVLRWNEPVNADQQAEVAAALGRPESPAGHAVAPLIAGLG